jgi:hypothetical protein
MPVYVYALINASLAMLVLAAIVGVLVWSVATQHRHAGCENVRLRRPRLRIRPKLSALGSDQTQRPPEKVVLG